MSGYIGLVIAFVGALLQSTLLHEYRVVEVVPDVVLLAVIGWSALRRLTDGLVWAVLGGLSLDAFSAGPFGSSVAALVVASAVSMLIATRMRRLNSALVVIAAPIAVMAYYVVAMGALALGGATFDPRDLLIGVVGPALFVDTALAPVALLLLASLSRLLGARAAGY